MGDIIQIVDEDGNSFGVKKYNGHYFSPLTIGNVEDQLKDIKDMAIRKDDVFLLSYPRCGTHWTREIINMLQRGEATYIPKDVPDVPPDFIPIENVDKMTSPRPLFAHLYFQYLPKQFIENKGKIVHVTRNPKDCAVSFYMLLTKFNDPTHKGDAFYKGSWNQFVKLFCRGQTPMGSFIEYHKQLEKATENYPIQTVYYENLKQNPIHEIKKIADFLEVLYTDKLIQEIAEKCKFTSLQKEKTDKKTDFLVESSLDEKDIFYRKGEVGDWKNWFTVAQNEMFDKWLETGMKDSRLKFKYSL